MALPGPYGVAGEGESLDGMGTLNTQGSTPLPQTSKNRTMGRGNTVYVDATQKNVK